MRRGLGRGRTLIAAGAILAICSMLLAWLTVGGVVLPTRTASGFEVANVTALRTPLAMPVACLAMLALIVLPFTTRSRQSSLDRPAAYALLLVVALAGLGSAVLELVGTEGSRLTPPDAPGLWLAIAGMALATWGVLELLAERPQAP